VLVALIVVLVATGLGAVVARTGDTGGDQPGPVAASPPATDAPERVPDQPPAPPPTAAKDRDLLPHVPAAQQPPLEELMAQVAEVRGLEWMEPLNLRVVSRDDMVRRLRAANARDTDPAQVAAEEATLKVLKLIPARLDYSRLIDELLDGLVLGFYDPETTDLYVAVGQVDELSGAERSTIVHEMLHALTDQHFRYGPATIALDEADKAEESLAFSALLEGDARLTEFLWMERHLSEVEALGVLLGVGSEVGSAVDVLARTPSYVQQSLFFPYQTGLEFVERLHEGGGFAAVNAAYRRPPASTEQVLHPEAYTADENSSPPALPDVAGASGCSPVRSGSLGEFDMRALLDQHAGEDAAAGAARGWNGDAYAVVRCGNALALADRWQADSGAAAARLAGALRTWAGGWSGGSAPGPDGRFAGPNGAGRVVHSGSRVDLVLAQTADAAGRVARALG